MKQSERLFLAALGLSIVASLIWLIPLLIGYSTSIPGDIEKILTTVIQLDGVLFGFGAALFSFLLKYTEKPITQWGLAYATTAFVSFFLSILFSFIALLNGEQANTVVQLIPISFTLTGVLTIIAFLTVVGDAHKKKTSYVR